jgi:hypothetical protein
MAFTTSSADNSIALSQLASKYSSASLKP